MPKSVPGSLRFLLATLPQKGHLNPMIGVAQELCALGMELRIYTPGDCSAQLSAAGLQRTGCPVIETAYLWPEEHCSSGALFAERSQDAAWLRRWIRRLLLDTVHDEVDGLRALLRDLRPDVLVVDPMYYAAIIAAQCEDLPWVGVSSSLNFVTPKHWKSPLVATIDALDEERKQLFAGYGSCPAFRVCDAVSPWLNVVFTTERYVSSELCADSPAFRVGPTAPVGRRGDEVEFAWDRLDETSSLIYMSLGSQNFSHERVFSCVVSSLSSALESGQVQLVLALHDLIDSDFARALPAGVIALRYAPQLELLKRAALVVSHGGANTVMESLHQGVPLLLIPMVNDQHLQGKFLARSQAGIVLDPANMSEASCKAAIATLLAPNNQYRHNAVEIGRSYRARKGAAESAGLIVEVATRKETLRPRGALK
ncbi:MAG: glycosyltransferase family 1 protein [Kofleriaceae bacterium]|nr:glycosyltransferase family 1 protein [Kofleriaceae bacterium]